ncbi:MAG: hypothetical protein HRU31_14120 [Rhodobacteraceae bacterium]|nr:hypothetical protein [Paracoccaceae bacterium]
MQKDVEAQQKLLGCITPMDVMAWQAEVLQSAYSDYALHSKRMMDLISSVAGAPPDQLWRPDQARLQRRASLKHQRRA